MSSKKYGCWHTPDAVFEQLKAQGFYMYRETFMWGRTDGFRNDAGELRYVERGVVRTDQQQFEHLKADWQPQSWDDCNYWDRCLKAGHLI